MKYGIIKDKEHCIFITPASYWEAFIAKAFLVNLFCELFLSDPSGPGCSLRHAARPGRRGPRSPAQPLCFPSSQWEPESGRTDQSQAGIGSRCPKWLGSPWHNISVNTSRMLCQKMMLWIVLIYKSISFRPIKTDHKYPVTILVKISTPDSGRIGWNLIVCFHLPKI